MLKTNKKHQKRPLKKYYADLGFSVKEAIRAMTAVKLAIGRLHSADLDINKIMKYHYVEVIEYETGTVVRRIDISRRPENEVDKIDSGLNRQLNQDKYYTVTSKYATPQNLI